MSYRVKYQDIKIAHANAWLALFEKDTVTRHSSWKAIGRAYENAYNAKLIRTKDGYQSIEFEDETACFLFILEWS